MEIPGLYGVVRGARAPEPGVCQQGGRDRRWSHKGYRSTYDQRAVQKVPEYQLAGVETEIITQILSLLGTGKIILQHMDAKSAFRQVGVAPDRAAAIAYRREDLMFVDLYL